MQFNDLQIPPFKGLFPEAEEYMSQASRERFPKSGSSAIVCSSIFSYMTCDKATLGSEHFGIHWFSWRENYFQCQDFSELLIYKRALAEFQKRLSCWIEFEILSSTLFPINCVCLSCLSYIWLFETP